MPFRTKISDFLIFFCDFFYSFKHYKACKTFKIILSKKVLGKSA